MERKHKFSLIEYYEGSVIARKIDRFILAGLFLLIIWAPFPFGSVLPGSILILEIASLLLFILWMIKLVYGPTPDQHQNFQEIYRIRSKIFKSAPFFHRHERMAQLFRLLTFQKWPRKYVATNLVEEESHQIHRKMNYFCIFGHPVANTGLELPALCFIALVFLQCISFPDWLIRSISPHSNALYKSASQTAGIPLHFFPVSLASSVTITKGLEYISYFLAFLVVVNNVRTRRSFHMILLAAILSALFQSIYGLTEMLSGHQHIFTYQKNFGVESATGTFINRNHFAAYLELALPLLLAFSAVRILYLKTYRGKLIARISHALETEGSQIMLLFLSLILISAGIIFSLSRSGICFALISSAAFWYLFKRNTQTERGMSYIVPAVLGVLALTAWIGIGPLVQRFLRISENWQAGGARLQVWSDTIKIFFDFPLTGSGAGTFEQIFPMYRSFVMDSIYRQAHNDYLQILAEAGIFAAILMIILIQKIIRRLIKTLTRESNALSILHLGAFCALLSLALHSLTDFGLQIPAIALQGAVVLGLFFTHYQSERHETNNPQK